MHHFLDKLFLLSFSIETPEDEEKAKLAFKNAYLKNGSGAASRAENNGET